MRNWYDEMTKFELLKVATRIFRFASSAKPEGAASPLVKVAYDSRAHEIEVARTNDSDSATCKVQFTESKNKITIGVTYLTDVYAFPLMEETWLYTKAEGKRAIKTYNRIVNVLEDLKADAEEEELPTPSIQGKVREELRYIDIERKKPAISRSLAASREEPGEADWRKSLYGNRYPQPTVVINNTDGTIYLNNG